MIKPVNNKVLVSVNLEQKDYFSIGSTKLKNAISFAVNYRERSPTIAFVEQGNDILHAGDLLLTHHNLFQMPSPYHLYDDLFSVPFSKVLFAKIYSNGDIAPLCGNLICKKIEKPTSIPVPNPEYYINKYEVLDGGWTKFKEGDVVLTRPYSGYEIVYILNGEEKRVVKVDSDMICGYIAKNI